jgi:plastocyanin
MFYRSRALLGVLAGCMRIVFRWLLAMGLAAFTMNSLAASVVGEVKDQTGQPLLDAVIVATPVSGLPPTPLSVPAGVVLDQHNREFIPHVLVVRAGTEVSFPNHDNTRHHVYSFSAAKRFEIKLYKNMPPNPIRFDMPGIAVLGCNIHDWMLGYVYVSASPYFTKTDSAGRWSLELPAQAYTISFWHPDMAQSEMLISQPLTVLEQQNHAVQQSLTVKNQARSGKPPAFLQAEEYKGEP